MGRMTITYFGGLDSAMSIAEGIEKVTSCKIVSFLHRSDGSTEITFDEPEIDPIGEGQSDQGYSDFEYVDIDDGQYDDYWENDWYEDEDL